MTTTNDSTTYTVRGIRKDFATFHDAMTAAIVDHDANVTRGGYQLPMVYARIDGQLVVVAECVSTRKNGKTARIAEWTELPSRACRSMIYLTYGDASAPTAPENEPIADEADATYPLGSCHRCTNPIFSLDRRALCAICQERAEANRLALESYWASSISGRGPRADVTQPERGPKRIISTEILTPHWIWVTITTEDWISGKIIDETRTHEDWNTYQFPDLGGMWHDAPNPYPFATKEYETKRRKMVKDPYVWTCRIGEIRHTLHIKPEKTRKENAWTTQRSSK